MVPTLRHGDAVVVRRGARVRPGDVVVGRFHELPDRLMVKRAVRRAGEGWWLEGDSADASDDSRVYGHADVEARVVLRYWPPWRGGRGPRYGLRSEP